MVEIKIKRLYLNERVYSQIEKICMKMKWKKYLSVTNKATGNKQK